MITKAPGRADVTPWEGLTETELQALCARARVRAVTANTIILSEGDRSDSVFIIESGRVKVFLQGEDGKEVVLNVQGPGEYFGDLALDDGARSASVATLEPSRLYVVTRDDFRWFLGANPDFALRLIGRLMHRVRVLTGNVRNLALLDVYGRVVSLLHGLAVEQDGRLIVPGRLTQKDIGDRVGASREMVSRIFKDLVTGGYVTVESRQIIIHKSLPAHW
jgi:CRP/FNR family transcriptional regulator, cyclic AMP receptor protein